MHHIIKESI